MAYGRTEFNERDDLPASDARIPDPFHGWQFNATDLPAAAPPPRTRD